MATGDKKISELTPETTINFDDLIPFARPGSTDTFRSPVSNFMIGKMPTITVAALDTENPQARADLVCDGVADEITINAAIAALPASGGTIKLLEGTYTLAASIDLDNESDIALIGAGNTTILSIAIDTPAITIEFGSDLIFQWLNIVGDGDALKTTQTGIAAGDGGANNITIQNCIFDSLGRDAMFALKNSTNWLIAFNTIKDCQDDGINPGGGTIGGGDTPTTYTRVVNNHISGVVNDGIHVSDGAEKTLVWGNIVTDCGNGIVTVAAIDTVISDNVIESSGDYGIRLSGAAGENAIIANNLIIDSDTYGIYITSGADTNAVVVGNQIRGATTQRGIFVSPGITFAICNNVIIDVGSFGIVVAATVASDHKGIIANNILDGGITSRGISIDDVENTIIEGNQLTNITAASGIVEAAACNNNVITNNMLKAAGSITVVGANTRVYRNFGYVTESSGTATIPNGVAFIDVAHGLDFTPALANILVTPTNDLGNATKFWISNPGAANFRINVDADPGVATATFSWNIERL